MATLITTSICEEIAMPKKYEQKQGNVDKDENRDAITGEPGSHPVGAGLGAAAGGAAAGAVAGPIGAGIGAVVGGVAGGLAGKAAAESIDPTAEQAYWKDEYQNRSYYDPDVDYETNYAPAYQYGWESRDQNRDRDWEDVEPILGRDWESRRGFSSLGWDRAKLATRDAWNRIGEFRSTSDFEQDEDTAARNRPR
jgi:uncharacterized protein YcfJ